MLESVMAKELTNVRPILLLHVGIVIFSVSAAPGKLHLPFTAVEIIPKRPIEELTAIIGVKGLHSERQFTFDVLELSKNALGTLVPRRPDLCPTCANIGECKA